MKKVKSLLITTILAVCAAVVCLAFAACSSSSVSGKAYVFSDIQFTYDDTVEEEDKVTDEQIEAEKQYYNGMTITFNEDGTYVMARGEQSEEGYYKQIDGKVYLAQDEEDLEGVEDEEEPYHLEVSGNTITMSSTYSGKTVKYIFTKK